jgi:hypothetical protein
MQDKAGKASGFARNLLQDSAVMMLEAEWMTPNKASRKGKRKNQKPQQSMGDRLKKPFTTVASKSPLKNQARASTKRQGNVRRSTEASRKPPPK